MQVLGNRSLKLKYLNSNTMFLATGSTPEQPGKAHVTAHIFDTITGRLLFSQTHEVGFSQPSGTCTRTDSPPLTQLTVAKSSIYCCVKSLHDALPQGLCLSEGAISNYLINPWRSDQGCLFCLSALGPAMLQSNGETRSCAMQILWPLHPVLAERQGAYTQLVVHSHRLWPMTCDLYND